MMRSGLILNLNVACSSSLQRVIIGKGSWGSCPVKSFAANSRLQEVHVYNFQIGRCPKARSVFPFCSPILKKSMAASGSQAVSGDVYVDNLITCGHALDAVRPSSVFFGDKRIGGCKNAGVSLNRREPSNLLLSFTYLTSDAARRTCYSRVPSGPSLRKFRTFSSLNGAAPEVQFDIAPTDEQVGDSVDASEQINSGKRSLKLISGSFYLPHPDKQATGGEDAHFICGDEQVIGVADGVGGWADVGVDAGEYARQLMSNSVSALQEEPKDSIDPAKVLEKAHSRTKVQGSSTACIIALKEQGIHAINLGDSGFLIIRDGSTVFRSPVQQYGFNFPYQLESGTGANVPSAGQVFTISVVPGDVIVAGTDGLFDNVYNNEINTIVVQGMRTHSEPQVMAEKIAALARERAEDRHRQTPFSAAAQSAGIRFQGGKLDDITVVVSIVTDANT